MRLAGAGRLFVYKTLWRRLGLRSSGRALVHALGAADEDLRTIAGMFLVQGGRQAEPLLLEALARRENLPMVLSILGDIGDQRLESELRRFTHDSDAEVARAAQDALRVLGAHR